jgi:hypothetical protein
MDCAQCEWLRAEREYQRNLYVQATRDLDGAAPASDIKHYRILKKAVDAAKTDLEMLTIEIAQHLDEHAMPRRVMHAGR